MHRDRPLFLTWLALSWQSRPGVFDRQIHGRREFLTAELSREEATLHDILGEVGHPHHEAVWMVDLTIKQIKVELRWLEKLQREIRHRAPARRRQATP